MELKPIRRISGARYRARVQIGSEAERALLQADELVAPDHDVVEHLDVEQLTSFAKLLNWLSTVCPKVVGYARIADKAFFAMSFGYILCKL